MKKWKAMTASILAASVLFMGVPLETSAQETIDYSIFELPKSGYLKQGDRGENVKILQRALNEVVSAGLAVDGVYGAKTKNAVLKFQKTSKSLKDTGVYDRKTHEALSEKVNSYGFAKVVLKEGSRGEAVRILQKGLNELGYGLKVDGHFGPKTKAAVIKFQKRYPELTPNGIFDKKTRNLLDKVLHD
ncbi:peptidoglycan-binding domain-containing protein [Peribacillus asahii]|uniref:peptidoglycan-binding domain-containing protein n=1 Tax=Peribacillus asahii TaxID=228899 RepID=UPI00207AC77B|nr:peptidoglycan-binding protein [Peribacillus asahii]USK58298.1 peptidoglycan-binding protein [Peribacillus asahii]